MPTWWVKPPWVHLWALGCIILVTYLSLLPGKDVPKLLLFDYDKLAHMLAYFGLSSALFLSLRQIFNPLPKWLLALMITAYGFILEILQGHFYTDRFFDLWDVLANMSGVLLVVLLWPRIEPMLVPSVLDIE